MDKPIYKQGLLITLQESVVLSQRNATEGAHRGLDYITGSSLFGAVAASLYEKENIDSFQLFHSGKVRFRNAYPLNTKQEITYPMPLCWYEKKKESSVNNLKLDQKKVWRIDKLENQAIPDKSQPKQVRNGYISETGNIANVKRNFQLKTAINEETKRAKEEALFGYESIQKGQQFYCEIEADDNSDLTKVSETLAKGIFIGRSRSAEYGKAHISLIDPIATQISMDSETDITIWCLSDAMIYDKNGQVTFTPTAADIGLPANYKLDITHSHIRTRSYSPWNQYKQAYELEKQVIQKGSILVYSCDDGSEKVAKEDIEALTQGIGVDRTVGLGHVWINPPLLAREQPEFKNENTLKIDSTNFQTSASDNSKTPSLITWLDNTAGKTNAAELQAAREDIKKYEKVLLSARELEGRLEAEQVGPSRSQWGALLQQAKNTKEIETLFAHNSPVCGSNMDGWKDRCHYKENSNTITIKQFVEECVNKQQQKEGINPQRYLQFLAREAMSLIDQGGIK